jgi:hypothetical protein
MGTIWTCLRPDKSELRPAGTALDETCMVKDKDGT